MTATFTFRRPTEADHAVIAPLLNEWWDRRSMSDLLPRLFFQHFTSTSLVAETESGDVAGFVVAFISQDDPTHGYIHFVGVDPALRSSGLGRDLYERTFATLTQRGCTAVEAITSTTNTGSIAFHARMGFEQITNPDDPDGIWRNYDAKGGDRVIFRRKL